jgi:arginyl-tRNA synthetase
MVLRDPVSFFADQVSKTLASAMEELNEEGWRDLIIKGEGDAISVASGEMSADITLEVPPVGYGDFAFPCFQLTRFYESPPNNIAFRLFPLIKVTDDMEPPQLAGPYINFAIRPHRFVEETLRGALTLGNNYGNLDDKRTRVLLEHTSANPNGPLHIGRARNPILGDALARVMRMAGYEVTTQYYLNDMGRQVVLLHWGWKHQEGGPGPIDGKADHVLVGHYQRANRKAEELEEVDAEVRSMMTLLEVGNEEAVKAVRTPALLGLEGIQQSLDRLDIHHDSLVSESTFVLDGSVTEVIDRLAASEYTVEEEDGALALELESFGVQGRSTKFVFRRKDGTSLYTTRDLAYHIWKQRQGDRLVNVLGEDHKLEASQLQHALDIMGTQIKVEPVFYAFVSLPEGKMSTREGRGVLLDDLMDEAVRRATEDTRSRRQDLDESSVEAIARAIGLGAVRYNILRVQPEKSMVFRWEEALSFEGASAPFIQYSHTRACSILRKAEEEGEPAMEMDPAEAAALLSHEAELTLARHLARLPRTVDECAEERKVHTMAAYANSLASAFNAFYRDVPVLQAGQLRQPRLQLVMASRIALANALGALGIAAPEQM